MFPSPDNNSDHENPLESLLLKKPSIFHHHHLLSDHHQNPMTDKQDDNHDPPFFFNFPSPFFDEQELPLSRILPHHNPITAPAEKSQHQNKTNFGLITKRETTKRGLKSTKLKEKADNDQPSKRQNIGAVSRKRTGKKDRHSKISTAQGIRDRRMRLSLEIARKFFDLQDMLGYDKASSTIEWLFSKSNKAIKELMKESKNYNLQGNNNFNFSASDGNTESFLSECEVVSGVNEVSSKKEIINGQLGNIFSNNEKKSRKIARKPNNNLRESREKARARARWRTREKMMVKRLGNSGQLWANISASPNFQNDCDLQKLGFFNSPLEGVIDQELSHDAGTIEKLLGNSSLSTSNVCPIFDNDNYQYCTDPNSTFMGFLGNWELLSNLERFNNSQFTVTNQGSSMAGNSNVSVNFSGATSNFPLFHQ